MLQLATSLARTLSMCFWDWACRGLSLRYVSRECRPCCVDCVCCFRANRLSCVPTDWSFIVVDDQLRYSEWTDYLYGRSGLELADIDAIIEECGTATPCFVVPAGSLGFSVSVFSACGVVCLGSLVLRRSLYGYELGGKMKYPFGIFFIALWLLYVGLSTWKSYS
jgi:hypothetical protein